MFFQNWKLSIIAIIMIPLAAYMARSLGKRMNKASVQAMDKSGLFTTRLIEVFKNHKLIKIFQREDYENKRSANDMRIS